MQQPLTPTKLASSRKTPSEYFAASVPKPHSHYNEDDIGNMSEDIVDNDNCNKQKAHIFIPNCHFQQTAANKPTQNCIHIITSKEHISYSPRNCIIKPSIEGINMNHAKKRNFTPNCKMHDSKTITPGKGVFLKMKNGVLSKLNSTLFKTKYKEVYTVLEDCKFSYYSNGIRKCFIDFAFTHATLEAKASKQIFQIHIPNSNKHLEFKTTFTEYAQWVWCLKQHISHGLKSTPKYEMHKLDRNFYKWEHINENKLLLESNTGDILLFNTETLISGIQRVLTRSDYDHVAMLLKYTNSALFFIEATSNEVSLLSGCEHQVMEKLH